MGQVIRDLFPLTIFFQTKSTGTQRTSTNQQPKDLGFYSWMGYSEDNNDDDSSASSSADERHRKHHKKKRHRHDEKKERRKKKHKRRRRDDNSDESSSSHSRRSETDSSEEEHRRRRRKRRRKEKKQERREKKRRLSDPSAHSTKDNAKVDSVATNSSHVAQSSSPSTAAAAVAAEPAPTKVKNAPMTREEYEALRNTVREVYDEQSGRYRLVRGTGEIIERIVSRQDHESINRQATYGDGQSFARQVFRHAKK
eukprot:scaffold3077_cov162-Amphora_coffeaeformis.AAC.31